MRNKHESKNDQRDIDGEARGLAVIAKAIRDHADVNRPETHGELQRRDRKHTAIQIAGMTIAAIYAGLTLLLLLATRDAVHLTREEQRAWVGPTGKDLTLSLDRNTGAVTLAVPLTNTGKTPALRVRSATFVFNGPLDQRSIPPAFLKTLNEDAQSEGTLLPNGSAVANGRGVISNMTALLASVDAGTERLYIIGRVTYDVVGGVVRHETEFCYIAGKDPKNFAFCPYFNDAR